MAGRFIKMSDIKILSTEEGKSASVVMVARVVEIGSGTWLYNAS